MKSRTEILQIVPPSLTDAQGGDEPESALSCAAASVLRTAREYSDDMKQLSGAIHVTGNALLRGGDVTIAPGTVFIFDADSSLDIGWNGTRTTLTALGTADKPIRSCSDRPVLGRWGGLRLSNGLTSDSVIRHAHIYDAGADGPALAKNLHVTGCAGVALVSSFGALTGLPRGSSFSGNGRDVIEVPSHGPGEQQGTWPTTSRPIHSLTM